MFHEILVMYAHLSPRAHTRPLDRVAGKDAGKHTSTSRGSLWHRDGDEVGRVAHRMSGLAFLLFLMFFLFLLLC